MSEIPEYVGYANELVDKWGERIERTMKDAVNEMATKSDLALMEERAQQDRKELAVLRTELKADKEASIARGRRIWTAVWSTIGTVFLASGTVLAAIISTHP